MIAILDPELQKLGIGWKITHPSALGERGNSAKREGQSFDLYPQTAPRMKLVNKASCTFPAGSSQPK